MSITSPRNVDLGLGRKFLLDHLHREDRGKVRGTERRLRRRMQRRRKRFGERGQHVHPRAGNLAIGEQEFQMLGHRERTL